MKIEKAIYEGYLWYSNDSQPKILHGEEFDLEIANNENPFIIEGQLYDANRMHSISIKYVDGAYICSEYDVESTDFNKTNVEKKTFHSNRMEGVKLQFLQYWDEATDDLCEGMKVLRPSKQVFVGFVEE